MKSSPSIWHYVVDVKLTVKISSISVAFLENMNKFMFSTKATTFDKIFTVHLTLCSKCQIDIEDFDNFCGLLRKHEFY